MTKTDQDSIVEAAAALLDRGGIEAVTLRAVGLQAHVSRGAPYRYFATKSELLAAIASAELNRLAEAFSRQPGSGAAAVKGMMLAYLRWALSAPERFHLT